MSDTSWQFEHSVDCRADKSFAWSFWTKVSNWERIEGKAVEWLRLNGPFAVGTSGSTKVPGRDALHWKITQLDPGRSATIEMALDGAVFYNKMMMVSIGPNQTRITQHLSLAGPKALSFTQGMQMFETSAPQGLAKLAKTIASSYEDI